MPRAEVPGGGLQHLVPEEKEAEIVGSEALGVAAVWVIFRGGYGQMEKEDLDACLRNQNHGLLEEEEAGNQSYVIRMRKV